MLADVASLQLNDFVEFVLRLAYKRLLESIKRQFLLAVDNIDDDALGLAVVACDYAVVLFSKVAADYLSFFGRRYIFASPFRSVFGLKKIAVVAVPFIKNDVFLFCKKFLCFVFAKQVIKYGIKK